MKRSVLAAALLTAALAGCTTQVGPVEVTRFSRPEATSAQRGAVSIEAAPGNDMASLEFRNYAGAVSQELARLGFSPGSAGSTVAMVDVQRQVYAAGNDRGPVSVGVGGSTGGWRSGVGLGLGFNLGGGPKDQVETRMAVMLRDRASGQTIWEGRARFIAPVNSPLASPQNSATKMAQALFQGFPGRSGETILVR